MASFPMRAAWLAKLSLVSLSLSLSVAALGCSDAEDADTYDGTQDEIIGGQPYDGDPATLYMMEQGRFSCTASLIAPRVVLTARHCLPPGGRTSGLSVGTGPRADGSNVYARVSSVRTPPGVGSSIENSDIAILILDRAGSLTPYRPSFNAPRVGESIVGIGYGQTNGTRRGLPAGRKYRGTGTIGSLSARELVTARPLPCYGDSGGPLFNAGGEVIGVVSRGTASTCEGGRGVYTRVDAFRAFIEQAIRETGGTVPPGPTPSPNPSPNPNPNPAPTPNPSGVIDICARPFEGALAVDQTLTFGCSIPALSRTSIAVSAPQAVSSQLTIEGTTYPERTEDAAVYPIRPRAAATPFELRVRGTNRSRPMPLRVELRTE